MKMCPTDPSQALIVIERNGIEIDYCPSCRGIWLDRGELDKLLELEKREIAEAARQSAAPAPAPVPPMAPPPPASPALDPLDAELLKMARDQQRREEEEREREREREYYRRKEMERSKYDYRHDHGYYYKKKKHKSVLGSILDILD